MCPVQSRIYSESRAKSASYKVYSEREVPDELVVIRIIFFTGISQRKRKGIILENLKESKKKKDTSNFLDVISEYTISIFHRNLCIFICILFQWQLNQHVYTFAQHVEKEKKAIKRERERTKENMLRGWLQLPCYDTEHGIDNQESVHIIVG